MPHENDVYCCCQLLFIYHGVYLIAFHFLLQAICGAGIVLTSTYKPQNSVVNYTTIASNLCFIPTGILVFWANVYENWRGAKMAAVLTIIIMLFNFTTSLLYFWTYAYFRANSLLDRIFFWTNSDNWIGPSDFPFTLWHVTSLFLVAINGLWCYYATVICRLSSILKMAKT